MKKITLKQRYRDVLISYLHRTSKSNRHKRNKRKKVNLVEVLKFNHWVDKRMKQGVNMTIRNSKVVMTLPQIMNFSSDYELTNLYLTTIRKLASRKKRLKNAYRLSSVSFYNLESLSTSAALVLTAEISK